MESPPPPPLQSSIEENVASTTVLNSGESNMTVEKHTEPNSATDVTVIKKKMKNKKKRKDVQKPHSDVSSYVPQQSLSSFSSSTSSSLHPRSKGRRACSSSWNVDRCFCCSGVGKERSNWRKDVHQSSLSDSFDWNILLRTFHFSALDFKLLICTLAVKESLSNVFGNKFDCFVSNFERSFQSTLMTLRVINETSENIKMSEGDSTCDFHFDMKETTSTSQEQATIVTEYEEHTHRDIISNELAVLHDSRTSQQLTQIPPNQFHMISTLERSVSEQTRSNNLKEIELSLTMKKMKLKEAEIAVNCDSNILERFKLSMGISKANFRTEKFKTELEETRHAQLLKKCADCLVAGLLIMLACLAYGTYVYSHEKLMQATESCMPTKGSSSSWFPNPMASFNSGLHKLWCQFQVISHMLSGILIIIAITYILLIKSGTTNQTMPVTFLLLLLGVGCGVTGKFCIDTLGGSGYWWLFFWEVLCLVHFFSNVCTSMLFHILHGPVTTVSDGSMGGKLFPYWFRRLVFYAVVLVCLPLLCGLIPFAGPVEWFEHIGSMVTGRGS
ncbi:hypothetical protein L2E82_34470 [Cichorium intybus]|uniref:Uncharacterized protein n=1 Tax=Cichorium intybus TaxID=13427 RepID=A0ACB9BMI1_CICIN|nr:hypothetical protein L2E82_34470 [Cichorium intybus]